jgi:CdiI N-terminal domain
MVDPATATYIFGWPMYRVNENVFIQNHILFFDQLQSPFDERNPFSSVPERQTTNEDGDGISEWSVRINELEEFLTKEYTTQFQGQYVGAQTTFCSLERSIFL